MTSGYKVTAITQTSMRGPDGGLVPAYEVSYETTSSRPVTGSVVVPASLAADRVAYSTAVKQAIEAEVAGHAAVMSLGQGAGS